MRKRNDFYHKTFTEPPNSPYLCDGRQKNLIWSNHYRIVRDVFTNIDRLCERLSYRLVFSLKIKHKISTHHPKLIKF